MDNQNANHISLERLAAYMDGNLTPDEMYAIDETLGNNPELEELVAVADQVDDDIIDYTTDELNADDDLVYLPDDDFPLPDIEAPTSPNNDFADDADTPADDPTTTPDDAYFNPDDTFIADDAPDDPSTWDDSLF